jgi:hypothetical protein
MRNEEDRTKRKEIYLKWLHVIEEMNPMMEDRFSNSHAIRKELGYTEYREMTESLSNFSLSSLRSQMDQFLEKTEDMYEETLRWILNKKMNLSLKDAEKHDISFLFRGEEYDRLFPERKLLAVASKFVTSMNLDPYAEGNISYDVEKRDTKSPRAFCSTIHVPEEVILVIMPSGGYDDYSAFLHELGHALHFGYTDDSEPFEHRCLGDNSVTEGYAMCLDHLLLNSVWLKKVLELKNTGDFLWFNYLRELYMLRRYAAKLSYEIVLHSSDNPVGKGSEYASALDQATKAIHSETMYLYDVDPDFYCARYLRAWLFEAMLSQYLREHFDEDWFLNPRTGNFLKGLWSEGQKRNVEELLAELKFDELKIEPLIENIQHHLES